MDGQKLYRDDQLDNSIDHMVCTYIDYIRGLLAKSVHAHTVTARAGERAERERGRRGDRARVDAVSAASAHGVAPSPHWSLVIRTAWALGLAVAEFPLTPRTDVHPT